MFVWAFLLPMAKINLPKGERFLIRRKLVSKSIGQDNILENNVNYRQLISTNTLRRFWFEIF
jgi:hypothetical protein